MYLHSRTQRKQQWARRTLLVVVQFNSSVPYHIVQVQINSSLSYMHIVVVQINSVPYIHFVTLSVWCLCKLITM